MYHGSSFTINYCTIWLVILKRWLYLSVGLYKNFWVKKAKQPGTFTYIALGDSAAQGIGASSPMRGYVGLIAKNVEQKTGKEVKIINLSSTGAKINDVLTKQLPQIDGLKPDLVTIEIGANDVSDFNKDQFTNQYIELIKNLPTGTYVGNMPYFGTRKNTQKNALIANKIIAEELSKRPDLHLVDLQSITKEKHSLFGYAPDGFHPNNLSYKNWAEAFWEQINNNL